MNFLPMEIIKKKRNGFALTEQEIDFFIQSYTQSQIPDYQMSALLMAIYFQGMNAEETLSLTKSMLNSGVTVDLSMIKEFKVDKHSTGGVGDKTSLILGPIVAAAGLPVPMISGRGLGHTGGTLDKLESIPGFNTQLSLEDFKKNLQEKKICFIGQTKDICPADKKIYALRDVTATVESLPLICASIISKKIAEGIDGLVLDVKFGSGAFMKKPTDAEDLAKKLMGIAQGYGKKVVALLTNMNQPLGRFAGNSLEVEECVDILKNRLPQDPTAARMTLETRELSLALSAHMIYLGGKTTSLEAAHTLAENLLNSGQAYEKFIELCKLHGGQLEKLPSPKNKLEIFSSETGYISSLDTEAIGVAGLLLKAGRAQAADLIEPTAGLEFHKKVGDPVKIGEKIFTIYGEDPSLFAAAQNKLLSSLSISLQKSATEPLIKKILY